MWQAALINALTPGPYIFWTLATGAVFVAGWREPPANAIGLLGGFYATVVSGLAAIILVFGLASKFGARANHAMLGISTIALVLFGFSQLAKGML